MKKLLKISIYIILSVILIIVILFVTASLSQKKIVDIALKKLSESITIPVEIEDLSFTFIKRFPYATVELSGVKIGAVESNQQNHIDKDILNIKSVFVSLKTIPLIKGNFEIIKIEIDEAEITYKVDSLGCSNISFLKDSSKTDTTKTGLGHLPALYLKKLKLKNIAIYYANDTAQTSANLFLPSLDFAGEVVNEQFSGNAEGNLRLTEFSMGITNLKRMEETTIDFNLHYEADTLQIKSFQANSDGADIAITGKAAIVNSIYGDLDFVATELNLDKLVKYAPDNLLNEYGVKEVNGLMNLSGSVKGYFTDSVMPAVDLSFALQKGSIKLHEYPIVKKLDFEGRATNGSERNNKTTSIFFKSFHAETDSSSMDLSLTLTNTNKPKYNLNSKLDIYIEEFKDYVPDSLVQNISGVIIADLSTQGQFPDSIDNNFINFVVNNSSANVDFKNVNMTMDSLIMNDFSGSLIYTPGILALNNLKVMIPDWRVHIKNSSINAEITGEVTQPQKLGIKLNSFYVETPQGNVYGSAEIENMEHPGFVLDAKAMIDLAELKTFLPDTLFKSLSGNLEAEINTHGKLNLDSIPEQANDIVFTQSKLNLNAKNIALTMPDTLLKLTDLNGLANMDNGTIYISKMSGIAAGIDFSIDSTTISNIYDAVINNRHETLRAQGNLEFGAIDYSTVAPIFSSDSIKYVQNLSGNRDTISSKIFPEEKSDNSTVRNFLFECKGKIAAKSFRYEKIFLEDISAKFNVSDSVYIIDQFKLNAFDGSTNSSFRFSNTSDGKQIINLKSNVDQIDIKKLLFDFDNFGQDSLITYENISGLFSANVHSRFVFEADTLATNDIRIMGDLALKNGRIYNYQPAIEVEKFTGIKEMDDIELKTLKCNIFMFKNKIYVPITDIVSTSMDLSTFGMQSLSDGYEYHLQMRLGEILTGKSKKLIERQNNSGDEISEDDVDKNTIKLIYAYSDGKKKVGFDTKKAQKRMELKIQVQQKMLELIFHPKLVSFETGVK